MLKPRCGAGFAVTWTPPVEFIVAIFVALGRMDPDCLSPRRNCRALAFLSRIFTSATALAHANPSPGQGFRVEHDASRIGEDIGHENPRRIDNRIAQLTRRSHQAHATGTGRGQFRIDDATRTHCRRASEGWHPKPRHLVTRIDASHCPSGRPIGQACTDKRSRNLARAATRRHRLRVPHPCT